MFSWEKFAAKVLPWLGKKAKEAVLEDKSYFEIKQNNFGSDIPKNEKSIVLFIHGFGGEAVTTWGKTPEFLLAEPKLKNWDVALLGYNSGFFPNFLKGIWAAPPEIPIIGKNIATVIESLSGEGYNGITICAHSMGGLATQKAMVDMSAGQVAGIRNIMLFGTPSMGLKKANLGKFINDQVSDMAADGDFIKKLRADWGGKFGQNAPFNFISTAGDKDQFVPPHSSLEPFEDEQRRVIGGDHLSMVKATSKDDQAVLLIKNNLRNITTFDKGWDPVLVEVQIGNFEKALAKHPNLDPETFKKLKERFQVAYLMALDGTGQRDKALELGKHIGKSNTDVMGKLAGIYKRMYLTDGFEDYYNRAYSLYSDAFKATPKDNFSQQYYHGINLAFLETHNGNKPEAKKWATIAVDSADKAADNIWKWATVGEAKIYLDDIPGSIIAYKKAMEFDPELWMKESMLINAREALTIKGLNNHVDTISEILGQAT